LRRRALVHINIARHIVIRLIEQTTHD
jgi:hypothetical protein